MLAVALTGCAGLPGAPAAPPPLGVAEQLLGEMQAFVFADPRERDRLFADAVGDLALDPSPLNRLRVAALQGWPGHANSRPAEAMPALDRLVEDPELDAEARDLALVLRFWIAQRGTDQRLQRSLRARISTLERELEETREQLAALAAIERMLDPDLCNDDDCPQDRNDPAR